jgi:predicted metal-dependent hydrolase
MAPASSLKLSPPKSLSRAAGAVMKNLPPFTVRESSKAKRVILKISVRHGLEVVIPQGFSTKKVPQIIREKRAWIERAFRTIQRTGCVSDQPQELPAAIYCEAIAKVFKVDYEPAPRQSLELTHINHSHLRICGDITDVEGCQYILKRWLQYQGRVHLIPWLEQLSSETKLSYQTVQIRGQKSRWGSCSSRGTISLNYNLLFLRPEVVRYLIFHELCHTVHLNHSAKFYQLLAEVEPDYQDLRAEMKKAWYRVPWWAA